MASILKLEMRVYQGGILRVVIDEKYVNPSRFRLSEHDLGAVIQDESVLKPVMERLEDITSFSAKSLIIRTKDSNNDDQ